MPHHIPSHFSIQANPCSTHISWPCAQASTILCCLIFYTDYATTSMPGRHKMHACDSRMARLWHSILSCKPLAQIELDAARLHFRAQMAYNASACLQSSSRAYTAVTVYQPMPSSTPTNKAPRFPMPSQCMCSTANHRSLVLAPTYGVQRLHHTATPFSLAPLKQQPCSTGCLKACVLQGTRLQMLKHFSLSTLL